MGTFTRRTHRNLYLHYKVPLETCKKCVEPYASISFWDGHVGSLAIKAGCRRASLRAVYAAVAPAATALCLLLRSHSARSKLHGRVTQVLLPNIRSPSNLRQNLEYSTIGCQKTVQARKLECDRPLLPKTEESRETSITHPTTTF